MKEILESRTLRQSTAKHKISILNDQDVPSINITGDSEMVVSVTPKGCQGSNDPWTKTTFLTSISYPPNSVFVFSI